MEKRKRGILSFMGEQNTQGQVVMVPLHKIEANPQQPRKIFNDESIAELTGSIKEYGVLQPIILREQKGYKCSVNLINFYGAYTEEQKIENFKRLF